MAGDPLPGRIDDASQEAAQEEQRKRIEAMYENLGELEVVPVRLIQGGEVIDLITTENTGAAPNRPFMVVEVAHPDPAIQTLIYKGCVNERSSKSAINEIVFLEEVAPKLHQALPDAIGHFTFPQVVRSKKTDNYPYCLEEQIEGRIAGDIHTVDGEVLAERDIEDIAIFIHFVQNQLPVNRLPEIAPNLQLDEESNVEKCHRMVFSGIRREAVPACLGEERLRLIETLFNEKKEWLNRQPRVFAAGDINPTNIIKTDNGKMGMIDWERIMTVDTPARDYSFMFASLWDNPDLQERFLRKTLEINQDNPDFKELFRLEYLLFRGIGELGHWWRTSRSAKNQPEIEQSARAIDTFRRQLADAIEFKGIWAEFKAQN